MTSTENSMLTMKIIKLLGIAGIAILAASFIAARVQRRDEEEAARTPGVLEPPREPALVVRLDPGRGVGDEVVEQHAERREADGTTQIDGQCQHGDHRPHGELGVPRCA